MPNVTSKRYGVELTLNQLVQLRDLVVSKANDLDYAIVACTKGKVTVGERVPSYYATAPDEAKGLFRLFEAITGDQAHEAPSLADTFKHVVEWDNAVEDSVADEMADA